MIPPVENVRFRESRDDELPILGAVHADAFGSDEEAELPMRIAAQGLDVISVVGEMDGILVAHAMLSPLGGADKALALAPVAVVSDHQGGGIGTALVAFGLDIARDRGWRSVFVLGEPDFYARFGFRRDLARGAVVPWAGPMFQALELDPGSLAGWSGLLRYPDAFGTSEDDEL